MAISREKQRSHRKKTLEAAKASVRLHQPILNDAESLKSREKIKVPIKARSALIQGEGRSMGMEID